MFHFRRRRRNGRRDDVRADIGDLAVSGTDGPGGPGPEEPDAAEPMPADTGQDPVLDADDGLPESIPPEDRELMRESRRAREAAREKNRRDDQTRQTVFACACVVAGFCGVAGVIFGTAAVCKEMATGPGSAMASGTSVSAPYIQGVDPSDMNVYYDQAGRMHVNVYVTRQPDVDVNIRIDGAGNVTSETMPREEGDPAETPPAGTDDPNGASTDPVTDVPGDGEEPGGGQQGGESDTDPTGPPEQGDPPRAGLTEEQLLDAFNDRRNNGGSGYLDSDGTYVVQHGDTLTKVSRITGFSVDFLAAYNQLRDKNLIITGEVLRYPAN